MPTCATHQCASGYTSHPMTSTTAGARPHSTSSHAAQPGAPGHSPSEGAGCHLGAAEWLIGRASGETAAAEGGFRHTSFRWGARPCMNTRQTSAHVIMTVISCTCWMEVKSKTQHMCNRQGACCKYRLCRLHLSRLKRWLEHGCSV